MVIDAINYDKFLKADGGGAFSRVEYKEEGVVLRIINVKELTGIANFYFDNNRSEVITGQGFNGMVGSVNTYRLRYGTFYKFITNINIIKALPENVIARARMLDSMYGDAFILPIRFDSKFIGRISFVGMMTRRTELSNMFSFAKLQFSKPCNIENKKPKKSVVKKKNIKKSVKESKNENRVRTE